jgi:hypothetical protein
MKNIVFTKTMLDVKHPEYLLFFMQKMRHAEVKRVCSVKEGGKKNIVNFT